jgi:hypothetical protein
MDHDYGVLLLRLKKRERERKKIYGEGQIEWRKGEMILRENRDKKFGVVSKLKSMAICYSTLSSLLLV